MVLVVMKMLGVVAVVVFVAVANNAAVVTLLESNVAVDVATLGVVLTGALGRVRAGAVRLGVVFTGIVVTVD